MKNRRGIAILLVVLAVLSFGCHKKHPADAEGGKQAKKSRTSRAAKETKETEGSKEAAIAGKASVLYVLVDRNTNKNMTDGEVKNRDQIGDWMDEDLVNLLEKKGYTTRLIRNRSEFKHAAGAYLLSVRITNYNPGSKAARMFVGYGAGAASMNTHYELYGSGASPILSDDLGVGSGRDWRNVIRKLNEQTIKAVSEKLSR